MPLLPACRGPKLSVADEQFARGEYFDASKTYRKIYNKLNPREQRQERAQVAYKMAECPDSSDRMHEPLLHTRTHCVTVIPTAL